MAGNGRSPTGRSVVLFPFSSGSPTTPMLQLAVLLHARGLGVTMLHAEFNAPDPARHPELGFVSIHKSLPDEVATSPGLVEPARRRSRRRSRSWCAAAAHGPRAAPRARSDPCRRQRWRHGAPLHRLHRRRRAGRLVGVVLNTFDAIEGPEMARIRRELSRPVFAIGPFLRVLPPAPVAAACRRS
ncbi:DIMBOA UDP-glucosyltransferase BX8-like [Panicum miliaceum]|uniref:DIMBOA UDP-glucosyltransferase BX8-like n=1 Tax=Panicum miliaceum TaxID=4540 RepID=A0A3L6QP78_PANMI|nr:DIMBOA UDP-glucosyltransferase BX8-like [Panicum miliaceum]